VDDLTESQSLLSQLADTAACLVHGGPGSSSFGGFDEEDPFLFFVGEVPHHALDGVDRQLEAWSDLLGGLVFQEVCPANFVSSLCGGLGFREEISEFFSACHGSLASGYHDSLSSEYYVIYIVPHIIVLVKSIPNKS